MQITLNRKHLVRRSIKLKFRMALKSRKSQGGERKLRIEIDELKGKLNEVMWILAEIAKQQNSRSRMEAELDEMKRRIDGVERLLKESLKLKSPTEKVNIPVASSNCINLSQLYGLPNPNNTHSPPMYKVTLPPNASPRPRLPPVYQKDIKGTLLPLLISRAELFRQLWQTDLITPRRISCQRPPYPHWYNDKLRCDFHCGGVGHSIETCPAFEIAVNRKVQTGIISLDEGILHILHPSHP